MRFEIMRLFDYHDTKWADVRTQELQYCIDHKEDLIIAYEDEQMIIKKEVFIGKTTEDFFRINDIFYESKFSGWEPYQLYSFEFKPGIYVHKEKEVEEGSTYNLFDPLTDT